MYTRQTRIERTALGRDRQVHVVGLLKKSGYFQPLMETTNLRHARRLVDYLEQLARDRRLRAR